MQSGYPQSQGGGSPAFYQHWHSDTLQSMQKNSAAPAPIFKHANGQNILPIPNELKVAYGPPQRQSGNGQSSQHSLAFPQKKNFHMILGGYGPQNLTQIMPNGHHHKSKEVDSIPQAFVQVSVQAHDFPTSGNVGGQQRKLPRSNLNNYKEHQQKQLLNCSSLESHNSAVIQTDSLGVAAQTSERMMRLMQSSPMLCDLLQGNRTNKASLLTVSSPSEENNGNNCRHSTIQNPYSSGTQTRSHQQQDTTPSVSSQRGLPAGKTDEQILDYIKEKIKVLKALVDSGHKNTNKRLNSNNVGSLKSNIKSDTSAHSTTFNAEERQGLYRAVTEHSSSTLWLQHEVDSSEGSKANPEFAVKSDVMDSCATPAPEQRPTEYPQIMQKVAGSLTKNEDEVPIALTTLSGMTMDEPAGNHPGSTLNCSSSEKQYKPQWLNTNSNLDSIDQVPGVSWSLMSEEKRGAVPQAMMEVGQVDCVEDLSSRSQAWDDVSEYVKAGKIKNIEDQHKLIQHTGSKLDVNSRLELSGEHSNQKHLKGKQGTVYLGFALSESKAERQESLPANEFEIFCNNLQYEDISDEDQPCMVTPVAKTIQEGSNVLVGCRNPQYEDISEDDNSQGRNFDMEIQKAESNGARSPLKKEDFRHKQVPAEMKEHDTSIEQTPELPGKVQECCCPYYIETEDGFERISCPKCERHLEQQKDQPIVCSSLSDQKNEDADGQNSDSESDDDFIVIPLTVSSLRFESEDPTHKNEDVIVLFDDETSETEDEGRQIGSCSTHTDLQHPASVPQAANCIQTYGTLEHYLQEQGLERFCNNLAAKLDAVSDRITSDSEMSSMESIPYPTVPSETEGSSDTEDSSNYSFSPGSNYLTVSKSLLVQSSLPRPVEEGDSVSAAENKVDVSAHTSKTIECPTSTAGPSDKYKPLINSNSSLKRNRPKVNKQRFLKQTFIIDSESEDESGQNCKKVKKRLFSSRSDAQNTQRLGHPPKVYHAQFEDAMNDDSSDGTNATEKTRHLVETNASSEHVPHKSNRCKISENDSSDTKDRSPDLKKVKRKSSSSELGKSGKAQKHSPEPAHRHSKTGTEKVKKSIQSFANSSYAQNKVYDAQLGDMTKKPCSDLSDSGQQIKANVVSKHLHKTSKEKGSKPKRTTAKVSGSKLSSSSTIPHLVVNKSREHCDGLKLSDKDETRTLGITSATKKDDYRKKKKLKNVNESNRGKFVSKPQLPKDNHHQSEKRDQANKAKSFSRQLSLPNQLPSTSKNNCESRKTVTFSGVFYSDADICDSSNRLTFEQNPSILKQHSSRLQQSHYSSVSSKHGTPSRSVSPPTMQTSAKKQVTKNWNNSYFPTRKDKKTNLGAEEDTRSNNTFVKNTPEKLYQESSKDARPGPSHERVRHRHNSHESDPPLMKRAKDEFRKLAEGRIRDPSMEQSRNVGEGYKWKEKPPAARPQKVKSRIHRR